MLTPDDLLNIKKIIREEIGNEVKDSTETLESKIIQAKMQIQNDIRELEDRIKNVEISSKNIDKTTIENKKKIDKVQKTVDIAIKMFSEDDVKLAKRVGKIKLHLGLPSKN